MDPDSFAKEFEGTEENPRDVVEIREEIFKTIAKEEELRKILPTIIKVSIFTIDLSPITRILTGKY